MVVVRHTQVGRGVGDCQPPEEGVVCDHTQLVLRLTVLVPRAPAPVVLFLLSAAAVALLVAVVLAMVVAVVIATFMGVAVVITVALAVVVATVLVVAVVVSTVVALVVALAPPLLLRVRVPPPSPVLLGLLLVASSPLCFIITFVLVPAGVYYTSTICRWPVRGQLDQIE